MSLVVSLVVLAVVLASAVARDPRLPSPPVAAVGALVLLAAGIVGAHRALDAIRAIGPTVGFLAALLVLSDGCRREGLFDALGAFLARRSGSDRRRLLALVFAAASAVTIALGLDATVVLLTPIVLLCAARVRVPARSPAYACVHLANSASLLLPVSNLTNLLAFRASGLSFARFGLLMLAPTVLAVGVEWVVLARWSQRDRDADIVAPAEGAGEAGGSSSFAIAVLVLTLVAFLVSSAIAVAPVWIAVGGAVLISLPALRTPARTAHELVLAVQPGFLVFVVALSVIVAGAGAHGLQTFVRDVLPGGSSLPSLLLTAALAAVLANVVNNLPATLLLTPVAAAHGVGPVLAVLVGVNVGPNLTEVGSLATLLWRQALAVDGVTLGRREFMTLGAITVPPALIGSTALLWLALKVVG